MNDRRRREPRVSKALQVRIWGLDSSGKAVMQEASTVDISRNGVRLNGVRSWDAPGEIIGVRHQSEKARYKVVWVGKAGTAEAEQIGLRLVDAGKLIWGEALEETAAPKEAARASAAASLQTAFSRPAAAAATARKSGKEARTNRRFKCSGGAKVQTQGTQVVQWATLADISLGGCYIETVSPLPLDTRVELSLSLNDLRIQARGTVRFVNANVGMGIEFRDLSAESRVNLQRLIAMLEQAPG